MNRRNFMKYVSGTLAGVLALPKKAKPQLTVAMLRDVADKLPKQKAGKIFWMPTYNPVRIQNLYYTDGCAAYLLNEDGSMEMIKYQDYYKQI